MPGGRHPTPITDRQKKSIAAAILSGTSVLQLWESGRFKDVDRRTIRAIADEVKAPRKRQPGNTREGRMRRASAP